MLIGVISDTHGLLRPSAVDCLAGADHVIHAGDIGASDVIEGLRTIAPTTTGIRGTINTGEWTRAYLDAALLHLAGRAVYVVHDLKAL